MTNNNIKPEVSIVIITYNHENYIADTLKGIFDQKTNFPFELIISNDCSTDNTDVKIQELINDFKDDKNVFYYNQPKNLGLMDNFVFALKQAKGKYIAFCEGDDYWTNPQKLQIQYDFLEKNSNVVFCFHNTDMLIENTGKMKPFIGLELYEDNKIIPIEKLFLRVGGSFPFPAAVFKKSLIDNLPPYFYSFGVGDTPLILHAITKGDVFYIDQKMCICRVTNTNWTSQNMIFENMYNNYIKKYNGYIEFDKYTNHMYANYLKITFDHLTYQVVYAYFQNEKSKKNKIKFFIRHQKRLSFKNKFKSIYRILFNS